MSARMEETICGVRLAGSQRGAGMIRAAFLAACLLLGACSAQPPAPATWLCTTDMDCELLDRAALAIDRSSWE